MLVVADHRCPAASTVPSAQRDVVGQRAAEQPGLEVGALAGRVGRDVLEPDAADGIALARQSSSRMMSSWATSTRRRVR